MNNSWPIQGIVYLRALHKLYKKNGMTFVILYTKSCNILLMQSAAGMKITSTQSLGVSVARTKSGLPRIIPRLSRQRIRDGDVQTLRV